MIASARRGPTPIKGTNGEFNVARQLTIDQVKRWCVDPPEAAAETLLPDWTGNIIGLVNLSLAGDNKTIVNASFLLQGRLIPTPKVIPFSKFWAPSASRVHHELVIEELDGSTFQFQGSLVSNLVDSADLTFHIRPVGGKPLVGTDLDDLNWRGFCLRAFIWPTTPNFAKLNILLYPLSREELADEAPLSAFAAFPGFSLISVEFPIGPPSTNFRFGLPFLPAITSGADFHLFPFHPSAEDFVSATAALLRKTTYPEIKASVATLQKRWAELRDADASALKTQSLALIWPLPSTPAPTSGRLAADNSGLCALDPPPDRKSVV